jgi:hypothetical protein
MHAVGVTRACSDAYDDGWRLVTGPPTRAPAKTGTLVAAFACAALAALTIFGGSAAAILGRNRRV